MTMAGNPTTIHQRPVDLLQQLIRFDTTNPPGNEAECIAYVDRLLRGAGIGTTILAKDPARPSLIARLAGRGDAPPLLLYAHIDVVSTANQAWQHPPFEGKAVDGCVWGRGALDDKGGAAMSLSAFLRAWVEGFVPAGDIILAILCDEENGGHLGAGYLVEKHPDQFAGVRYAIGEAGGFTFHLGGARVYPIMVAEKRHVLLNATVRGPVADAQTIVVRGGTSAKLGALLTRIDRAHLPVHVTPVVRRMFEIMSANVPFPTSFVLRRLLNPALTDRVLGLLGPSADAMYPLLHNTVNVTGVQGGEQVSGTPARLTASMIACLLPGFGDGELVDELRRIAGDQVEFEVTHSGETGLERPDMGLFDTLCDILREGDPQGVPVPLLLTTATDARHFARLGIQTYGFQPMKLPPGVDIAKLAHAPDERVPVDALEFGAAALYQLLQRYGKQ